MSSDFENNVPVGTKALIFSKWYYGVLSKHLENIDTDRYYSVLYFLHYHNGCCQQHICNNLAIDKTAMVKVIDHLIKKGLVDRNVNPNDRREHFIVLTKKGIKQSEDIVKAFQTIDDTIFSSITKQERQLFEKVLSTLSVNLKDLPSNDLFFNYKKNCQKTS